MNNPDNISQEKIPSQQLAALIIDALIDAKIIQKEHSGLAINIAAQEINIRKSMGDY